MMWTSPKLGPADFFAVLLGLGLLVVAIVWWSSWAFVHGNGGE